MKIKIISRLLSIIILVFVGAFVHQISQFAQQPNSEPITFRTSQGEELPENDVFEFLFKLVNLDIEEANKQEKLGFGKRARTLRTYYLQEASLSLEQLQSLREISENFQKEVDVLKKEKSKIETSLKKQPDETEILIKLKDVYEKRGRLWSMHRDLLREKFGAEKFEQFRQFLQANIASKIKRTPIVIERHPRLTANKLGNYFDVTMAYNYSYTNVHYKQFVKSI